MSFKTKHTKTTYTADVLDMADHLFPKFPTLTGLEILCIASEAVEYTRNKKEKETT